MRINKTTKGPGVVAVGQPNVEARAVFDELSDLIGDFYQERDQHFQRPEHSFSKIMKGLVYDLSQLRELEIQYEQDEVGRIIYQTANLPELKPVARINLKYLPPERVEEYVKEWDFPHAPFVKTFQGYYAYFNSTNGARRRLDIEGTEQRDGFVDYVRGLNPPRRR